MHITEEKIELLVYAPELIDENEKALIEIHLKECHLCMEYYQHTKNTFDNINLDLDQPPTSKDAELADRIYYGMRQEKRKLLAKNDTTIQVYDGNFQIIPQKKFLALRELGLLFKKRPILTGSFAIMSIAAIASLLFITLKNSPKDDNPVYAEIKAGILEVYNTNGKILWKKTVGNIPNGKLDEPINLENKDKKRYFSILDIDNDSQNEVLISGAKYNRLFASDSVYCFNSEGKLRWITSAGMFLNFGTVRWKHTTWNISDFFTIRSSGKNQLIVVAHDETYAPLIISKLDPRNGKVISSYYHCGWNFEKRAQIGDVGNDGNEEIIIGLTNNALRKAALLVLSPDELEGMSPADQNFYPPQNYRGKELYYIIFPISNFGHRFARDYSFVVYEMVIGEKEITINTNEAPGNYEVNGSLIYSFDKNMRVLGVIGSQAFNRTYDEEYKKGTLTKPRDLNYFKKLVNSVQYWDGDKFVNYYTMNKYFKLDYLPQNLP